MPRPPSPLPNPFEGRSFSVATSAANGVSRKRTRAKDLASPFHGVRTPARELSLQDRCAARATRLPSNAVFSHITAARLHRMPLPLNLEKDPTLHVTVETGRRAPVGKGTKGHQKRLTKMDVVSKYGVFVTTPVRTFCDLAEMLTVPQLVAVGDHLIRRGVGAIDRSELDKAVARHANLRHRARLERAARMLDENSESPKESELRAVIVAAGFPAPVCQVDVFVDRHRFAGRVDLAYPDRRIALEYEGDYHRDKDQWRKDIARRRRLEAIGWVYLSVTQADLDDPRAILSDLRAAFAR